MKHAHEETIVRWARDTSLVVLCSNVPNHWRINHMPNWQADSYFLVCEKHVHVALAWLSGSELQVNSGDTGWVGLSLQEGYPLFYVYLDYRIKPKTQKVVRYVGTLKFGEGPVVSAGCVSKHLPEKGDVREGCYTWTKVEVDEEV